MNNILPLLDTVETLERRNGDKDDNSLLAVANLDLMKITSQQASSKKQTISMNVPWTASRPIPQMYCIASVRWWAWPLSSYSICSSLCLKCERIRVAKDIVRGM